LPGRITDLHAGLQGSTDSAGSGISINITQQQSQLGYDRVMISDSTSKDRHLAMKAFTHKDGRHDGLSMTGLASPHNISTEWLRQVQSD
jgi:hypothetical protein